MKRQQLLGVGLLGSTFVVLAATACGEDFGGCGTSRYCPKVTGGAGAGEMREPRDGVAGQADGGNSATDAGGARSAVVESDGSDPNAGAGGETGDLCDSSALTTDPLNCGYCGHDCQGGKCTAGICQPVELASQQGALMALAVAAGFVYWGGDGYGISRIKTDGSGEPEEIVSAAAPERAYDLAVFGQTLFWGNDWQDSGVRGCAIVKCEPKTQITGDFPIRSLHRSLDGEHLYWDQGHSVWSKALPSGDAELIADTTNIVVGLATDSEALYVVEQDSGSGTSALMKRSLGGGESTLLASSLGVVDGIVVSTGRVFLANHADGGSAILAIPLPEGIGNETPQKLANAGKVSRGIAIDARRIFWSQQEEAYKSAIYSCPIEGCAGAADKIAESPDDAQQVGVDDRAVYWVTGTGHVLKVAK